MEHIKTKMTTNVVYSNNITEDRFKSLLFLFRLGGLTLNMKSVSTIRRMYSAFVMVCFYATSLCLFMDSFVHRHELVQAMKKIRILMGMQLITWIHFSLRYSTVDSVCTTTVCFVMTESFCTRMYSNLDP